ncbi:MAG: hypothetical protein G8D89_16325 [gamma proteobacterium symbiont of Clathrolucina costata]
MSQNVLGQVKFGVWHCKALLFKYGNDRPGIELVDSANGEPIARSTLNIPEVNIGSREVIVKDYSENAGMLSALVNSGIVVPTGATFQLGHAECHICRLPD